MNGKTIRIFLADGDPSGILTAEIINWTGKVLVAPRSKLALLAQREEARRTGVYLLSGPDPEGSLRDRVYVGEGDNVLKRITQHDRDEQKDYWTRVALVISKDENLTKSHGRYLESRLVEKVNAAGRAELTNGTRPDCPPLPESDRADMEYFLDQVEMVLPVLGFSFLQKRPDRTAAQAERSPEFFLTVAEAEARAQEINGEFIVLKGSTARREGRPSWTSYKALRDQLVEDSKLVKDSDPGLYRFSEDIAFSSPSAGAAIVAGGNMNGRVSWKLACGETYQDWHERKLEQAAGESADGE